jgi:ADP-heptose:LPS heptosyltransferase
LRAGDYDMILSSGGSMQVCVLLFFSGVRTLIGYDSGKLARRLLTVPVPLNKNQYAADMYHDLAAGLCRYLNHEQPLTAGCIPKVDVPAENVDRMTEWLNNGGTTSGAKKKRVVLHPGMSRIALEKGIIKTWEPSSWAQLIKLLAQGKPPKPGAKPGNGADQELEVILAGGPDDAETIEQILAQAGTVSALRNCFGVTKSLADLAALIQLADAIVCVDSAPMHIAVGLDKPTVALFGPTDESKLMPKRPHFIALRGEGTTPDINFASANVRNASASAGADHGVKLAPDTVYAATWNCLQ